MILESLQEGNKQDHAMGRTFFIRRHKNSDNLHLRLGGVFDVEAALRLLDVLSENQSRVSRIFVHTAAPDQVLQSAVKLFRSIFDAMNRPRAEIIFTGNAGMDLARRVPGIRYMS